MQRSTCLVIGHMTADLTPQGSRRQSGTASYATRTAHALVLRVRLLASVAPHEPLLDDLRPFLDELHVVPGSATSTFENLFDNAGTRTQILSEIAAGLGLPDVPGAWRDTSLVHLAPLTGEVDPALAAHFPNATVLLTPQGWLRERDEHGLVRFRYWFDADLLRHVDIVVFSEEDIAAAPGLEADFAASVPWLFVTRTEHGGTCYHHGVPFDYTTPQLPAVNTTGAGDVFAAAVWPALIFSNGTCRAYARWPRNWAPPPSRVPGWRAHPRCKKPDKP